MLHPSHDVRHRIKHSGDGSVDALFARGGRFQAVFSHPTSSSFFPSALRRPICQTIAARSLRLTDGSLRADGFRLLARVIRSVGNRRPVV